MREPIRINEDDNFVWKIVTDQAIDLFNTGLFQMYALHDDGTESLIHDIKDLWYYLVEYVEIGIEVGFANYREVSKLEKVLSRHDFTYEYSDNALTYARGTEMMRVICELSDEVDRETFISLWNRYAPSDLSFERDIIAPVQIYYNYKSKQ